ncbi:MAG: hypothetical protein IJ874_05930 [Ruminococcus sp.]|nr:hypothetical protein [Ruminococcus sp.]
MKEYLKRAAAVMVCAALLSSISACGSKSGSSSGSSSGEGNLAGDGPADDLSITQDEMPYGAMIMQLRPSENDDVKIYVEFDYRYLSEEDGKLLSDYVYALNNCDAELMEKVFYPPYLEYSYSSAGYSSTEDYLKGFRKNLEESLGEGFDYNAITVDDCYTEDDDINVTKFDEIDELLDSIGGGKVSDRINEGSRRFIYIDIMYGLPDDDFKSSYSLRNHVGQYLTLYLYDIDGVTYVI